MKFIDWPSGCFCDRRVLQPELEPIDVVMATLDAEFFIEKSLYTVYKEIPVRKLFICDGGSKDATLKILEKFPRVEVHVRPDIRTGAKLVEFLMSLVETKWCAFIDSDLELSPGWYDEMKKHESQYDVLENSVAILAYHKYLEDKEKLEQYGRAGDLCHLIRKEALHDFHCDDDYMWRHTDFLLRQVVEKSGYKYGKINTTLHTHNETERIPYASDEVKSYRKIVIDEPRHIIIDKKKSRQKDIEFAKGAVKYLDPDFPLVKSYLGFDFLIRLLDRKWVEENGPSWLKRYDASHSLSFSIKYFLYRNVISKNKKLLSIARGFYKSHSK